MPRFDQNRGEGHSIRVPIADRGILRSLRIKEDLEPLGLDHGPSQSRPPRADPEGDFPAVSAKADRLRRDRGFGLSGRGSDRVPESDPCPRPSQTAGGP